MSFDSELKAFGETCFFKTQEAFVETAQLVHDSIQNGSPITGAPGQPVLTGALRASIQLSFPSETEALISTNLDYAQSIEDGISYAHGGKPLTLQSSVGGFYSFLLTRIAFQRIVDFVTRRLNA